MKVETVNLHNLTMDDIQRQQHRVKIILLNSKNEILLCRRNGVYNFIGGNIEEGEGPLECAQREVREETGVTIGSGNFEVPFYKLQCYEKNYYNLGSNYYTTIQFLVGNTDAQVDLDKRQLDENELKQVFVLEYVPYPLLRETLERNRTIAKKEQSEFIIDEMLHVLDQYDEYCIQTKNTRGIDEER